MFEKFIVDAALGQLADVIRQAEGSPALLARVATLLLSRGNVSGARKLSQLALDLAPNDDEVRVLVSEVQSHDVGGWYFPMVLDDSRQKLYEKAFELVIWPGCRVLDIGSGTGLFAMMAARAGASQVVTCEAKPEVAAAVTNVVAENGLASRVRVVAKRSADLEVGVDLDAPADVVIWDNLNNNLIGAGALPAIEQAGRRLARAGARFIPSRGAVRIALAQDLQFLRMGIVEGFDLAAFNRLALPRYHMHDDAERFVLRSEPADLFEFDFESGGPFPEERASSVLTVTGGPVNGVAQWMRLDLCEGVKYENPPPGYRTAALGPMFHTFAGPIGVEAGQTLVIHGSHDRRTVRIWREDREH